MNPILIGRLVAVVGGLLGVAGAAYGVDQHVKRRHEQEAHRARLQQIDDDLRSKEEQLASLRPLLGDKNDQVRILAAEIQMLRDELAERRSTS